MVLIFSDSTEICMLKDQREFLKQTIIMLIQILCDEWHKDFYAINNSKMNFTHTEEKTLFSKQTNFYSHSELPDDFLPYPSSLKFPICSFFSFIHCLRFLFLPRLMFSYINHVSLTSTTLSIASFQGKWPRVPLLLSIVRKTSRAALRSSFQPSSRHQFVRM